MLITPSQSAPAVRTLAPPATHLTSPEPVDLVSPGPAEVSEVSLSPSGARTLGVALALGAAAFAGAGAAAAQEPAVSPGQSLSQEESIDRNAAPIPDAVITRMKDLAGGSIFDNFTASQVRRQYRSRTDSMLREAATYQAAAGRLQQLGQELDGYLGRTDIEGIPGLSVRQLADGSEVLLEREGQRLSSVHQGETWTVEAGAERLMETPASRSVTSEGRTRTLHLRGSQAGTFEVVRTGFRGRETTRVTGATVEVDRVEVVSGIAGDERIATLERFESPEISIALYPKTELIHTHSRSSENQMTGLKFESYRIVEVREDGSTRLRHNQGGTPVDTVEPRAIVLAQG
ncbi:MAG: hypothetical protein HY319_00610 [Armatimonadetes bacterium]|nr:hypothetical protein [Armatimonadota bacterium]